jgi:radical SAM protein with 4Fe4S-binding SPASM domain
MQYNTCWGKKIAITKDNKIRPCIFSEIIVGDIQKNDIYDVIEKIRKYWTITKDKVEKCRDCEFRYVCFDCREIAMRKTNDLYGSNPYCGYNPYTGIWL